MEADLTGKTDSWGVCKRPAAWIAGVIALMCACCPLSAQHFPFRSYGEQDGLRNLNLNCLLQDRSGRLLVCTEFGLYRYEAGRFHVVPTVEGTSSPNIQGITQDQLGRIWVSTPQKLLYLDASGVHDVLPASNDLSIDLRTSLVATADSRIYFISRHRLMVARLQDGRNTWEGEPVFQAPEIARHPVLSDVRSAYVAPDGYLWFGCGTGICEYNHGALRSYAAADGVDPDAWSALTVASNGDVWARGTAHVVRLPSHAGHFVSEQHNLPPTSLAVRSPTIALDGRGRVLLNTLGGIARLNRSEWNEATSRNGLVGGMVQTMLFDHEGSLWFDGGKSGLQRWVGYDQFENWTSSDGLTSDLVWAIHRDLAGKLWVGSERDLQQVASGGVLPPAGGQKTHVSRIQTIAETSDNHLWIGSDTGQIFEYNPASKRLRLVGQEQRVYQIYIDRRDSVWILADNGLFSINRTAAPPALVHETAASVQPASFYRAVESASGVIFMMTSRGLIQMSGGKWSRVRLPPNYHPTYNAQIAAGRDDTVWLSGASPLLMRLKIRNGVADVLDEASAPSLRSANIYSLEADKRGWLWVGTDSGLDIWNGKAWRHVGEDDGLVGNDIDTAAFYSDKDGSVWIGTSAGVSHVLHPDQLYTTSPLSLAVDEAKLGKGVLSETALSSFSWAKYSLAVHVSQPSFARAHAIVYRYKLGGVDDDWQQTISPEIRYPFVPDGRHTLQITAVDEDLHISSEEKAFEFEIRPPWWRSLTFAAACVASLAGVLAILWRWSKRADLERRRVLENLVQQRTKELQEINASLLNARSALIEQATRDALTGVLNRGAIYSALNNEIERAHRESLQLCVVMADLDHFKKINDRYGHSCGDYVLQELTSRLGTMIRGYDTIGRYGGEEFLILLPGLRIGEAATRLEEFRALVCATPVRWNDESIAVTCSFGVAGYVRGDDLKRLVDRADNALYRAKRNGRNCVEIAAS